MRYVRRFSRKERKSSAHNSRKFKAQKKFTFIIRTLKKASARQKKSQKSK